MDEQRVQAYLSLIQELLECPSGEELQILNRHMELVDEGFVQVCELVAAQLQEEGQDNRALFLRNVAQEVGQYLNSQTSGVATGEGQAQGTEQDYLNFLMQVLQLTSDTGGNASIIYNFLEQNLNKIGINFAQTLQMWAVQVLHRVEDEENLKIAGVIGSFSNLIHDFPIGNRTNNLEVAIVGYEVISRFFQNKGHTELWIIIQTRLGNAYSDRIEGKRAENIEKAINCYKNALTLSNKKSSTRELVDLNNFLGCSYSNRVQGDKPNNIDQAIMYFQEALRICSRDQLPEDWAMIQNNLGIAYSDRVQGEQSEKGLLGLG